MMQSDDEHLVEFLREREVPCPLCGYNLRGLTSPRCPECGRALVLSVGLAEPFLAAWVTLAVCVCCNAGIGVLIAIMMTRHGWPRNQSAAENMIFAWWLLSIPLAAATVLARRRLLRTSRRTQWWVASAAIIASVVTFLALAMI